MPRICMTMVLALGPVAYQVRIPCRITPHRWKPCLLLTDTVYGLARRITAMATSTGFMIYPKENGVLPAGEIHTITIYVIRLNWQLYNHSASYLYDYGKGPWSASYAIASTLMGYLSQLRILFGTENSCKIWSGTGSRSDGYTFIQTSTYWNNPIGYASSKNSSYNRVDFGSL